MLLAIDTSSSVAGVALYGERVAGECTWLAHQDHTRQLLPQVFNLLGTQGLKPADLTGIGVALGPGSFNGLRVGVAAAKALAFSLHIPMAGIGTLEAMAYQHKHAGVPVRPILDAGRGQASTALYRAEGEQWVEDEPPHLVDPPDLVALVQSRTMLVGEWRPQWLQALEEARTDLLIVPTPAFNVRRAGFLAELAWMRLQAGRADDPATLQPLYLRKPAITVSRRECG